MSLSAPTIHQGQLLIWAFNNELRSHYPVVQILTIRDYDCNLNDAELLGVQTGHLTVDPDHGIFQRLKISLHYLKYNYKRYYLKIQ